MLQYVCGSENRQIACLGFKIKKNVFANNIGPNEAAHQNSR